MSLSRSLWSVAAAAADAIVGLPPSVALIAFSSVEAIRRCTDRALLLFDRGYGWTVGPGQMEQVNSFPAGVVSLPVVAKVEEVGGCPAVSVVLRSTGRPAPLSASSALASSSFGSSIEK